MASWRRRLPRPGDLFSALVEHRVGAKTANSVRDGLRDGLRNGLCDGRRPKAKEEVG
jgi:hypothetical protein